MLAPSTDSGAALWALLKVFAAESPNSVTAGLDCDVADRQSDDKVLTDHLTFDSYFPLLSAAKI